MTKKIERIKNWYNKNSMAHTIVLYTIFFGLCFFFCCDIFFAIYNRSYMWNSDGLGQTYPMFVYTGKWCRAIIKSIVIEHKLCIPMWDMSIGFGADIISTMNSIWNPFLLLSVIFPAKYSELAFNIMIVLQLYFSGISFISFARYNEQEDYSAIIGALVYVFSATSFIVFVQSSFGYLFVLFPLVFMGIRKIKNEKKPVLYIVILAMLMSYSYYFTYMTAIFIVLYCMIDLLVGICENRKSVKSYIINKMKEILIIGGASLYSCVIGICFQFPGIKYMSQTSRLTVERVIPKLYSKYYTGHVISGFIGEFNCERDSFIGFSVIAIICCIGMFLLIKKYVRTIICFLLMSVSLLIPFVGHIFNGFNYETNRWIYGYAFLVSYIVTIMIDELYSMSIKKYLFIIAGVLVYGAIVLKLFDIHEKRFLIPYLLLFVMIAVLVVVKNKPIHQFKQIMLIMVSCSLVIPSIFRFTTLGENFILKEVERNTAYDSVMESGGMRSIEGVDTSKVFRYDSVASRQYNAAIMMGVSGYDMYSSAYNNDLNDFLFGIGISNRFSPHRIMGVDFKSDLEALFGTKYMIKSETYSSNRYPVGYTEEVGGYEGKNVYKLYKSDYDSSLISFFDKTISLEDYQGLNQLEKQKALMKYAVVENGSNSTVAESVKTKSMNFAITNYNSVEYSDSIYKVTKDNAFMDVMLSDVNESGELLLLLNKVTCYTKSLERYHMKVVALVEGEEKWNMSYSIAPLTSRHHMDIGLNSWLINLGNVSEKIDGIRVYFVERGEYSIDEIGVFVEENEEIIENIKGLVHPDDGITIKGNHLDTSVDLDSDGYVAIMIPYSTGWNLKVDGQYRKLEKIDVAFMGVRLDKGHHDIELDYRTPYLYESLAIAFILMLLGVVFNTIIKHRGKFRKSDSDGESV